MDHQRRYGPRFLRSAGGGLYHLAGKRRPAGYAATTELVGVDSRFARRGPIGYRHLRRRAVSFAFGFYRYFDRCDLDVRRHGTPQETSLPAVPALLYDSLAGADLQRRNLSAADSGHP